MSYAQIINKKSEHRGKAPADNGRDHSQDEHRADSDGAYRAHIHKEKNDLEVASNLRETSGAARARRTTCRALTSCIGSSSKLTATRTWH
jgi:hypothetical protein